MITDKLLRLCTELAVTADAAATDYIDLGVNRDIGEGHPLYMLVTVTTGFTGTVSIEFTAKASADTSIVTGDLTVGTTGLILLANLTLGAQFYARINPQVASLGFRYLGCFIDVNTSATAGAVTIDFVTDIQDGKKFHASGFAIT
jgi:hypothetical protein